VLARTPCTLRGDAPLFQSSASQFRNAHESCQSMTVTPVTPSSFPRSEPYAGPRADAALFHPSYGNGRGSSAGSDLVTSALCVHPSSSLLETDDIFTKAEPFSKNCKPSVQISAQFSTGSSQNINLLTSWFAQ